jgi:hypothetical protein
MRGDATPEAEKPANRSRRVAQIRLSRRDRARYAPSCQPFGIDDSSFFVYWCCGCR